MMKKALVTGGTVFVSRYVAEYYVKKGYEVYVLNRNSRRQPDGVKLIEADRYQIGDKLRKYHFDVVFDIMAYTAEDIYSLLDAMGSYEQYIMISSSAVYPEYEKQPFTEGTPVGENKFWGRYGTDKIEAEKALRERDDKAYILRPPYLYGPLNNVYREAFVFDCAMAERPFFLPGDGNMNLQFFHVNDLCRFMDVLIENMPKQRIFNVGNREPVSIKDWVSLCYGIVGKTLRFQNVSKEIEQRNYFSFYSYEYYLDVEKQASLMPETKPLAEGLRESFEWYIENQECVKKKPFLEYIDKNLMMNGLRPL